MNSIVGKHFYAYNNFEIGSTLFGDGWSRSSRDCVSMMVTREFQRLGRGDAGASSK
jgi:hypothetical protein